MQQIIENLEHAKKSIENWNFSIANFFIGETLELISDIMEVNSFDKNYLNSFRAIASYIKTLDKDWKISALKKAGAELREKDDELSKEIFQDIKKMLNYLEKDKDFRNVEWYLYRILMNMKKLAEKTLDKKYLSIIESIANYHLIEKRNEKLNALIL